MNNLHKLSILFVAVGLLFLAFTYAPNESAGFNKDVKVTYKQFTILKTGEQPEQLAKQIVRLIRADGSWKEIITDLDENGAQRTRVQYAINGKGLFKVSERYKKLLLVADRPGPPPLFSAEAFAKAPNFLKEDSLLSFRTIVTRDAFDDSTYTETHFAPDLNGLQLKLVEATPNYTNFLEAVNIKFEKITAEEFGELPDYPIEDQRPDYTKF